MALVTFVNDSAPYLNAQNLNNNFNELDNKHNYSTTEKVIGKWVDNKPIYQVVLTGTINDSSILLQNVDTLVNAYGTVYMNGNTRPINYYELYNNLQYFWNLRLNSNKLYMACVVAGQPYNPTNCNITLEYTKTTD